MKTKGRFRIWLVGIACVVMAIAATLPVASMTIFIVPMSQGLNASVGSVSLIVSVSAIGGLICSFLFGKLIKHFPTKLLIVAGGVLTALLLVSMSLSTNLIIIYACAFLQGFGLIIAGMSMAQTIISQWYIKARGTMMALILVFLMVAAAVAIPALAGVIENIGYQPVALWYGIIVGVAIVLLGIFCISFSPEKHGIKPWGYTEGADTGGSSDAHGGGSTSGKASVASLSSRQALATAPFWFIMLVSLIMSFAAQAAGSQASNFFQSIGLDPVEAGMAIAVNALVGIVFSLLFGIVADKLGPSVATVVNGVFGAAAFLLVFLWQGWTGAIISAVCFASLTALSGVFAPTALVKLFGPKDSGTLIGFGHAAGNIGSFLGPVIAGSFFDYAGNYTFIYFVIGVAVVIAIMLAVLTGSRKTSASLQAKELREAQHE
jgi:MFS family permease